MRILSWNVYHGTLNGVSPGQRIGQICSLALANGVDVICLQEVPQSLLDASVPFGIVTAAAPVNAEFPAGFAGSFGALQCFRETVPGPPSPLTHTTDGYLVLYRLAGFVSYQNFQYFSPASFIGPAGSRLRCPVEVELQATSGVNVRILNWHAEVGPSAGWSLQILSALLGDGRHQVMTTVVAGDFNVRGNFSSVFGQQANFVNWDNIVAIYPGAAGQQIWGLDHILTSVPARIKLGAQLNFTSDSYHYPIACDVP
ncbi:MAG: endonuclease/exonuclease/phosphatase family protein [Woeseiaceae bacterium]